MPKKSRKRRTLSHISKVAISIVTVSLMTSPVSAAAETSKVVTSGAKKFVVVRKVISGTYVTLMIARSISGGPLTPVSPADYFYTSLDYVFTGASLFHLIKR